jgi:transposase
LQLRRLDVVDADVALLDTRIDEALGPYRESCRLLQQIPGVHRVLAAVLVAELGTYMSVFHSAKHVTAWAGVCPGNNESAGKHKNASARKGNVYLRTALVEAAVAASRKKCSYLKDKFHRVRARRGTKRAAMAIGHKILIAAYHTLSAGIPYRDLGEAYHHPVDKRRVTPNLVRRHERLGYDVKIEVKAAWPAFS